MHTYLDMLRLVLERGVWHENRTGVKTKRVLGHQARYDLSGGTLPLVTTKRMPFKTLFTELAFFVRGETDQRWLEERGCRIWKPWSTAEWCAKQGLPENDLGPIYGFQWRRFGAEYPGMHEPVDGGVDQLARALDLLRDDPDSRRIVVSAWEPRSLHRMALPPCHVLFQLSVLGGKLYCHLYQRSADLFLGVPFNIASYALLAHLIAHVADLEPGELIHSIHDLHLYENHLALAEEQLGREPRALPRVEVRRVARGTWLEGLTAIEFADLALVGYDPHPKLVAEVAV